jgi:hypothetical protein
MTPANAGVIVFELFSQEIFQRFKPARLKQTCFQAAPPQNFPLQGQYVVYEHFLNNVRWPYHLADTREKLIVGRGVFAREQLRLTK